MASEKTEILVPDDSEAIGQRLDVYLKSQLPELSRARIQDLISGGSITVDGKTVKVRHPLSAGIRISVAIPEDEPSDAQPEDIPLDVLYEDGDLAVINKAHGMVVHPAKGNFTGTLVNALLHRFEGNLSIGGTSGPGIVHRLDKDTSGCIIIARNDKTHIALSEQFAARTNRKVYLAVVEGQPGQTSGTIDNYMSRHPTARTKMAVTNPERGKHAVTDYEVLFTDPSGDSSLVKCTLHTGRTHQIRVHLAHIGHPLIGDPIYSRTSKQKPQPGRLMLHAWQLGITHPGTGQTIDFEAPIPEPFHPWTKPAGI